MPPASDDADQSGTLSERWVSIGSGAPVELMAIDLWLVELPFRSPVTTAKGAHRRRPLVMVQVTARTGRSGDGAGGGAGDGTVVGWGECAALADSTFDREDVDGSFAILEHVLVPALFAEGRRLGGDLLRLPRPSALGEIRGAATHAPLAFAALEMAVADTHLRAERRTFAGMLGVEGAAVEVGAVVGQATSVDALVADVDDLDRAGYGRVKLKIGPGWDREPLEALRHHVPGMGLQVDANGSYGEEDAEQLLQLDRYELLCIEQPFPREDLAAHARLAARMDTPVCLDESLDSPGAVDRALAMGACSVVCVKPSRLGGLGHCLQVIDRCTHEAVPLWMGGMFESGYARGINRAIGALPGFSWPGDLGPSLSYLSEDLVPGPRLLHPSGPGGHLAAIVDPAVDRAMGMGPVPDAQVLERLARRRTRCVPGHG